MDDELREVEPMHPSAKKFLEVVFQDVTVDGISRRLEFVDEYGGETSVILHAPDNVNMAPVHLGFPAGWFPPPDEDWDEELQKEVLGDG